MLRLSTWREFALLVLAVVCLWIGGDDLRLFLFFAFAVALSEFGRLFSFVRQVTLDHEAKLTALCYNAQIPVETSKRPPSGSVSDESSPRMSYEQNRH